MQWISSELAVISNSGAALLPGGVNVTAAGSLSEQAAGKTAQSTHSWIAARIWGGRYRALFCLRRRKAAPTPSVVSRAGVPNQLTRPKWFYVWGGVELIAESPDY